MIEVALVGWIKITILLFKNRKNDIAKSQNVLCVCHVFVIKQRG